MTFSFVTRAPVASVAAAASTLALAIALAASALPASAAQSVATAPQPVVAKTTTPEFENFRKSWEGLRNYSGTIVAHETSNDGTVAQDRTYVYRFVKPNIARILVTAGAGRGGGAVWRGGDTVSGHQGGPFSFVKLNIAKNDRRAISLRGAQIDDASFGSEIAHLTSTPGTFAESKAAEGFVTIVFTPKDPEPSGVTKETLTISLANHLPARREQFVGERSVAVEIFSDLNVDDPALTGDTIER